MKRPISFEYSFEKYASVVDQASEERKAYIQYFDEDILPEMVEVERRKNKAVEEAYKIRVCSHLV